MTNDLALRLRSWCVDFDGSALVRETTPRDGLHCDLLYDAADEIDRLQAAHREIYEVWAGSEGLPRETASEAYLVKLILDMACIAEGNFPKAITNLPTQESVDAG